MKLSFLARTVLITATAFFLSFLLKIAPEDLGNRYDVMREEPFASLPIDSVSDPAPQKEVPQEISRPIDLNANFLVQISV